MCFSCDSRHRWPHVRWHDHRASPPTPAGKLGWESTSRAKCVATSTISKMMRFWSCSSSTQSQGSLSAAAMHYEKFKFPIRFSSIGKGPPSPRLSPSPEGRRAAVGPQPTLPVVPYHCSIFSPNPLPPDLLLMYPNYHWSFGEHSSVQVEHWAPSE